ncbi:CoA-binding protein [uncultured archaeon]|nr:CoA-binding protein [uncultured archaeon]
MLKDLFSPHAVAIIGASQDPTKIGNAILRNMIDSGYKGNIIPINPSSQEVMGLRFYPSIDKVDDTPELAVIALPASRTIDALKGCVERGVKFVIIIAGGFSELGKEGRDRELQLLDIIKGTDTRIIGPNTLGVYFPHIGVNTALTSPGRMAFLPKGEIAFVSQSGALGLLTMDGVSEYNVGISAFLNLGNRVDLNEVELLDYFAADELTKSIVLYLESVPKGREFFSKVKEITMKKPVVVLKSGRTEESAVAASLHTGAMASDDAVVNGAISQAGAVRAYDETEMMDFGRVLAYSGRISGDRIAIITTAGGVGVITADYISSKVNGIGMRLASLSDETKRRIREVVVPFASVNNPIDLTADGSVDNFDKVIGILEEDDEVDGIIAYPLPQTPKMGVGVVDVINKYKGGRKPIIVGVLGSKIAKELIIEFEKRKIPAYPSVHRTVKALEALRSYSRYVERRRGSR